MGIPYEYTYVYGKSHTHMGHPMCIWDIIHILDRTLPPGKVMHFNACQDFADNPVASKRGPFIHVLLQVWLQ